MDDDLDQCMNPHGEEGRRTIEEMNRGHVPQITWGIENLPDIKPRRILDVGCGGGIFTRLILERYPEAEGDALDISELSVEYARGFNADLISSGRLTVILGNVMDMPYDEGSFDLVVSNASHFFWPDIRKGLSEICRTLKDGGVLCLTAGMHLDHRPSEEEMKELEGITNILTDKELTALMDEAGMDSSYAVNPNDTFCAYIGRKRPQ